MDGPTGPTAATGATAPAGPYVEITVAEMHGADRFHVAGFVDDAPVEAFLKPGQIAELQALRTNNQRRKYLARLLRGRKPEPPPVNPLLGREDGI